MSAQAWTILGGLTGGLGGYILGRGKGIWTAAGALVGAVLLPPVAAAAMPELSPPSTRTWVEQLAPGKTIILRASVGDLVTVLAPFGWGVPSATVNIPGFMQIQSTALEAEATTLKITQAGQGQIQMSSGGETAILSIEAT